MSRGFTLIELLLVVVIIGIVAAFVLPKFGDVKEKAFVAAMKNDLRNLATEQEIYFQENGGYMDAAALGAVATSEDVTLSYDGTFNTGGGPTGSGYVAKATHANVSQACVINRTNGPQTTDLGDVKEGQLICQ